MVDGWINLSGEIVAILDLPLAGLLRLPRDVTLVVVALVTVVILVMVRRFATNQDQLRRCAADLRRLKQLRREARAADDQESPPRLARTVNAIKLLRLKADLTVLAFAIVPLGLLATWAVERLDFLPARVEQTLEMTAYFPLSSIGRLTHLVPRPDMAMRSPPLQLVTLDSEDPRQGRARWVFKPLHANVEFELIVHHAGEAASHRIYVGQTRYAPVLIEHRGNQRLARTHVSLDRYKFLGIDPGLERIGLAPWLVAYVVLTLVLTPIVRRLARVA